MCGIAGFIERHPEPDRQRAAVRRMTAAVAHRGPDDEGYYETVTRDERHAVQLGHRRLSIIDLNTGHQPIGNADGSIQIVFNGEIYNYRELRDALSARGYSFATASDTESIIYAYEAYGDDCVTHLRGMFAFALWDDRRQRLLLARDRFGKKPMFVYRAGADLYFASEIKALLANDRICTTVSRETIAPLLHYRYVPGPQTLFEGIEKLPPGHTASWHDGRYTTHRYYTAPDAHSAGETSVPDNPVRAFLDELDEAVRVRMVSDVPFGAFLSGGIDSSAVVGLMSRHLDHPVKTFAVGFRESRYSELGYARTIADRFGTDHHELAVSENDVIEHLPTLVRFRDAPVSEPSDIPIYLLSVEARKSVKMVLTGEGSDEFLGGYPKHVFERFSSPYQKLPRIVRERLLLPLIASLPYRFRRAKIAAQNLGVESWQARMPSWFGALTRPQTDALLGETVSWPARAHDYDPDNSPLRSILHFDQTSWLPDNLLERGDRMTMAASLEARMPFMDHKLAAFVSGLPDRYRVRGFTTKHILRQALTELLPVEIIERPKVGFRVPVNEWFYGPMRDYLEEHLLSDNSHTRGYFDEVALRTVFTQHVQQRQNHEKLLWILLGLEIWHREFGYRA